MALFFYNVTISAIRLPKIYKSELMIRKSNLFLTPKPKPALIQPFLSLLFISLFFCFGHVAAAQNTNDTVNKNIILPQTLTGKDSAALYYSRLNGKYFKSIWTDFRYVVARPAHWQGRDWAKFALITGTAGTLMVTAADQNLKHYLQNNQKTYLTEAGKYIEPFGNHYPPIFITGLYLTGVITHNRRLEDLSLAITRSVVISTALYVTSKELIRRQRPVRTDNSLDFVAPFKGKDHTSFPSGHSNTIFSIATAFSEEFKEHKWVPWVAYSVATLTAATRLYQNRHWGSDILIGASLGHFVTKGVYKAEAKRKQTLRKSFL